ncbi:MAG TPA: cellulase family glycosylhydrolase, partial [Rhodothermales bacterium]
MAARLLLAFALTLTFARCDSADSSPTNTLTPTRVERLSRGINTSHWFAQTDLNPARFTSFIKASDVRLIRDLGFRHIRLSLDPMALFQEATPGVLHVINRHHLDNAISMILDEGLGVVIDLHPASEFKYRMRDEPAFFEKVKVFWGALAAHLSERDPEFVFLEVLNEPEYDDAAAWQAHQNELLAVMRENAPNHTLIATGPRWSAVDELVRIEPVDDPNVVYNFHLYDP